MDGNGEGSDPEFNPFAVAIMATFLLAVLGEFAWTSGAIRCRHIERGADFDFSVTEGCRISADGQDMEAG